MAVDDIYTKSLLHMDGANASTTFTDESGKTWTASGNAKISTAQSKFGGAAGLFDGNADVITTPDSTDFDFGAGNFTIDFWAYFISGGQYELVTKRAGWTNFAPFDVALDNTGVNALSSANGSSWGVLLQWTHGGLVTTGNWHHFAFVRNGNVWSLYFNGVSKASATVSQTVMTNTTTVSCGATSSGDRSLNGYLDEVRISKGIARWTSDFTPPTQPYGSDLLRPIWFD